LFPDSTTYLGVRRDAFLRGYMLSFMQLLSPDINLKAIEQTLKGT
jgi:LysR family cys regulon transcriptional activator